MNLYKGVFGRLLIGKHSTINIKQAGSEVQIEFNHPEKYKILTQRCRNSQEAKCLADGIYATMLS